MDNELTAETDITDLLGQDGALSRAVEGFTAREAQLAMASDVATAMRSGTSLLVEAGTGTGKTFAYLVPAFLASGRSIIATGTRTLQDQLFYKDLPLVRGVVPDKRSIALLKGRANYLCPQRLDKNLKVMPGNASPQLIARLQDVRSWYVRSRTGDVTELLDAESDAALLPLVTSNVDNCLGSECPHLEECPLYRARSRAMEADIIVVNHHLLFADLAMQDDSFASLLPVVDHVIIDEAHQVADVARQFFGVRIGSGQLVELGKDVRAELFLLGNDDAELASKCSELDRSIAALDRRLKTSAEKDLTRLLFEPGVRDAIDDVDMALGVLASHLDVAAVRSRSLSNCYQRALRLIDKFALLTEINESDDAAEYAHWLQPGERGFVIHMTPVSIARHFGEHLAHSSQSWILTSATLTVNDSFDHTVATLGLSDIETRHYRSPYDFTRQVKSWLPAHLPQPGSDEHTRALVATCLPIIRSVKGRTFFLFTSYRALNLAAHMMENEGLPFLVQGTRSKAVLLDKFRVTPGCVLLATHSFWEGVDVKGAGLQCLVIDKLPFSSPSDPITAAQSRAIDAAGGNGFMDYLVPEAAITLRQGFGRRVRGESDRGLFILGDSRVAHKPYGRLFIKSLPEMDWLADAAAAIEYLGELALP